MKYNDSDIIAFGSLCYSESQMATLLRCKLDEVREAMNGDFGELYRHGEAKYNFEIDKKLMQMSIGGDLKALTELEKRKRRNARG